MRKTKFVWKNRERDLEGAKRYHSLKVMFYRTDHLLHSKVVPGILQALLPHALTVFPDLDTQEALLISKHHDDYEMVSGDLPLQLKLYFNGEQKEEQRQKEIVAAKFLDKCYGERSVGGYRYLDLLMHSILKDCRGAQLHSLADKTAGFGEAVHEVLAGNMVFLQALMNYLSFTFNDLPGNFPLIKEVFADGGDHYFQVPIVNLAPYFEYGRKGASPHTPESVKRDTGIMHYELWKRVTLSLPGGMERLTQQVEFHAR